MKPGADTAIPDVGIYKNIGYTKFTQGEVGGGVWF
jgi:hypothetical protein